MFQNRIRAPKSQPNENSKEHVDTETEREIWDLPLRAWRSSSRLWSGIREGIWRKNPRRFHRKAFDLNLVAKSASWSLEHQSSWPKFARDGKGELGFGAGCVGCLMKGGFRKVKRKKNGSESKRCPGGDMLYSVGSTASCSLTLWVRLHTDRIILDRVQHPRVTEGSSFAPNEKPGFTFRTEFT